MELFASSRLSVRAASDPMLVPLMQDGQPFSLEIARVNFAAQDLPASVFSHESSAVSSASFPLARSAWHLKMQAGRDRERAPRAHAATATCVAVPAASVAQPPSSPSK